MSIEAMRWAWEQQVKSTHKLVLMAIADGADAFGEAKLSQDFLAYKTEMTAKSVRTALAALETAGLMQRVRSARRNGQRGVDLVLLNLEHESQKPAWQGLSEVRRELAERRRLDGIAAGEDFGPDAVEQHSSSTQVEMPSQGHRKKLPVVDSKPVDNSILAGQSHRKDLPVEEPTGKSFRWSPVKLSGSDPSGHSPTTRAPVFYPSSSSVGPAGPVDEDDDGSTTTDQGSAQGQVEPSRIHRGVNLARLRTECAPTTGPWAMEVWVAAVDLILNRARSRVARPQAYVTGSILAEPTVLLDASENTADVLSEAYLDGLTSRGRIRPAQPAESAVQRPVRARQVSCPIHHTEHHETQECAGCRADRLVQHQPEEG